ncbi:hypothetical protein D6D15_08236 [Aureobasidium pullulans]|uniref:Uncharacterized protein n=1 Tax=Aureobasidium pullulans TaxID=5580 RepID=A0A4S9AY51_AURPU|nr:hypothetical protein D6D15_08236 [Aureobasidium pullulans]
MPLGFGALKKLSRKVRPKVVKMTEESAPFTTLDNPEKVSDVWRYWARNMWLRRGRGVAAGTRYFACGVSSDGDEQPTTTFTCNLIPRDRSIEIQEIADLCLAIASALVLHHEEYKCRCDFDVLCRGKTTQQTRRLCYAAKFTAEDVRVRMEKHNQLCRCECFDNMLPQGLIFRGV